MERECKILMVEFFNSLVLIWSLHEVLEGRYVDTRQQNEQIALSVDRPFRLSTEPYRQSHHGYRHAFPESQVLSRLAQPVDRLIGTSTAYDLWAVTKLDSECVFYPNLERLDFLIS